MGGERMGGLLQQNTEKLHIDKDFAYKESYAHEGIELGTYSKVKDIDKKMDLENNHRGRDLGEIYKANSLNDNKVATCLLEGEISGKLVRIREKTNSNNYDKQFYKQYGAKTVKKIILSRLIKAD